LNSYIKCKLYETQDKDVDVIIAIDSEEEYLDNTESLLSGAKYNFVKATQYKKGMDYAKTANPDLLMIGINKIDKELIDAVQFLKKKSKHKEYSNSWDIQRTKKSGH
jgi:DNA-binding response OmpR family regulator